MLEETVIKTFKKSGRGAEVTYRGIQDSDHPVLKGFPESLYLKGLAIRG
jgi:23S rRNA G2069 N7-methylase RlmK/C1962 C5-methylase RlmI